VDTLILKSGVASCVSGLHWVLLAFATMFVAGAGNVVNDLFDQDIDRINKPDKQIIGKTISEEKAWNFYYAIISLGLGLGIFLCWNMGNVSNALIFMLAAGGLYFYSYSYKRQFLIGNLVVALLAGLVPFLPIYLEMMCEPQFWMVLPWVSLLMAFSIFAFLTTLIREIIKDLQDMKGDQLLRCKTMPIVLGVNGTKAVVVFLLAALIVAVGWLQVAWWKAEDAELFWYFLAAVQLPTLVLMGLIIKADSADHFGRASKLSKLIMLGGVLSMVVFRFTLQ
jgi:4-hydroxybenzoate polyprenyltransferase